MYVYLITNKVNGKYYVGQTIKNINRRWREHRKYAKRSTKEGKPKTYFYRAIEKYGDDNFSVELLVECPDQPSLDASEKFFIWFLASNKPSYGYNTDGGGRGGTKNTYVREKIRGTLKGHLVPLETRIKIRDSLIGRSKGRMSEETKEKLRVSHKGKKYSESFKEKMRKIRTGQKHSESTKAKMREARAKRKLVEEDLCKI